MTALETLKFDNLALRSLPLDSVKENYVRQVTGACFSKINTTPVENPETVVYSSSALSLLDLTESTAKQPVFAEYFSGSKKLPGSETAAHCYCGHQFGYFSGQLGDGAAIYLGEVINEKNERWEIQLKGSGLTPYSRTADGRKVLRSSIREFLCSEAMYHLGIPTTRAGSCVTSDTKVIRDIFYDGNPIAERATIVLRLAQSFIRFGSFEICKSTDEDTGRAGPSVGHPEIIEQLLNYVIENFYNQIWKSYENDKEKMYSEFYREIVKRTARLVAEWQCVGWCHGVLNTDNMSILGVTIDYGPYGFMESFNPDFICNGSDNDGRYTYAKQAEICEWNCEKLAEAIQKYLPLEVSLPILKGEYEQEYKRVYMEKMRKKLGLINTDDPGDGKLVKDLFETMQKTGADFTNTFRALCSLPLPGSAGYDEKLSAVKQELLKQCCSVGELLATCTPIMHPQQLSMLVAMMNSNPDMLRRLGVNTSIIHRALEQMEKMKQLKDLTEDKKCDDDTRAWNAWLNQYTERLSKELDSSQQDVQQQSDHRMTIMKANNPKFILRNYIAQNAIEAAEKGDFSEVRRVLKLLENPFSDDVQFDDLPSAVESSAEEGACGVSQGSFVDKYTCRPEWAKDLRVT